MPFSGEVSRRGWVREQRLRCPTRLLRLSVFHVTGAAEELKHVVLHGMHSPQKSRGAGMYGARQVGAPSAHGAEKRLFSNCFVLSARAIVVADGS